MKKTKVSKRKIQGTKEIPRISVFRSLKYISVQAIDDEMRHSLVHVSDQKFQEKDKMKKAQKVGKQLAEVLKKQGIKKARFDKGHYKYHGRIKALVQSIRDEGIKI